MESPMAKWFITHYKEELNEKYDVLLTLEEEADSSIGISTFDKEIKEMIETFTSKTHAYQVTGLDEHLVSPFSYTLFEKRHHLFYILDSQKIIQRTFQYTLKITPKNTPTQQPQWGKIKILKRFIKLNHKIHFI